MRLGVVSDIHCNAAALQCALSEMESEVDEILVAGDAIYEYRFSDEVIDVVRSCAARYVLGNHEVQFLRSRGDRPEQSTSRSNIEFVASSPLRLETVVDGKRLLMVHGVPWPPYSDYVYSGSPALKRFAELDADIVVVGHTHVPMVERVGTTLIVNPGSIGESRGPNGFLSYLLLDVVTEEVEVRRPTIGPAARS